MLPQEFSSGGVIFRRDDKKILFLLIYSNRNKVWGFPKGHGEAGEDEMATALREIREETGLSEIKQIVGFRYEDVYETLSKRKKTKGLKIEKHSVYFLFETRESAVVVDNDEIGDYKWADQEKALDMLSFGSAKAILNQAVSFLKA